MSSPYASQATGDIGNSQTIPSDGDDATASSVDVPFETLTDDVHRLRVRASLDEATTFVEPSDGLGLLTTAGTVVGEMAMATWQLDRRILHANDDPLIHKSTDGGYTWATEYNGGSAAFLGLATQTDSAAAVAQVAGAGDIYVTGPGNAWTQYAIPGTGTTVPNCIVADPFNASTYWVGGLDGTTPKVWKVVTVNGGVPTQTQIALSGGVAAPIVVCPGRSVVLAASNDAGTSHLWSISGGVGTVVTPLPTASKIFDIQWLDAFGIFMMAASNGSTLELWKSPTGATGTWTAAASGAYMTSLEAVAHLVNGIERGACVVGPLAGGLNTPCVYMLPIFGIASLPVVLLTADGGASWQTIPDPMARHQTPSPKPTVSKLRIVGNRVVAFTYTSAGKVYHAQSARGGNPL